ncbi:hypothetical protein [Nonomuraea wenchangensis]|uniref:Uncharacterized protein n=1 Tax=Nonomuraea wenchangensis TaxID=568860 RepID=A0A1I0FMH1_9ACTN|nr:hypothetical protein [Nonomuraea wenchangensis]SET59321.1 hypothetical protein SAMN05421811_103530 [Nonomuraea wenchangensis]
MGETKLVKRDIDGGARLLQELNDRGFPVSTALWAHLVEADEWRLMIAVPPRLAASRAEAYRLVQAAMLDLELGFPLSRTTVVSDEERSVQSLRTLVEVDQSHAVGLAFGAARVCGQQVSEGFVYSMEALTFEHQVFAALRRMDDLGRVFEAGGSRLFPDQPREVDFVFSNARKMVFIEVAALTRKVEESRLRELMGWHARVADSFPVPAALLVVARNGFSEPAQTYAASLRSSLRLVTWGTRNDAAALREGIAELLNAGDDARD